MHGIYKSKLKLPYFPYDSLIPICTDSSHEKDLAVKVEAEVQFKQARKRINGKEIQKN